MSSAVTNLQKAIVEGSQSLTQLLRQTKVIAAKLGLADVEAWVDLELNGYPQETTLPKYRHFGTHSVEIRNPVRGWMFAGNINIPSDAHQPISEIENLAKAETLTIGLNTEENFPVGDSLGRCMGSDWPQRVVTTGSEFKAIVDAVINALLQWTTELEKRGIKGEDMDFNEKEKTSATHQVFNIQKLGVLGNITNSQVTLYDYSSVQQLLLDHQVPKHERRELEDIMDELKEAPSEKKPSLIARGEQWIAKHKEVLGAAVEAVVKAVGTAHKP